MAARVPGCWPTDSEHLTSCATDLTLHRSESASLWLLKAVRVSTLIRGRGTCTTRGKTCGCAQRRHDTPCIFVPRMSYRTSLDAVNHWEATPCLVLGIAHRHRQCQSNLLRCARARCQMAFSPASAHLLLMRACLENLFACPPVLLVVMLNLGILLETSTMATGTRLPLEHLTTPTHLLSGGGSTQAPKFGETC